MADLVVQLIFWSLVGITIFTAILGIIREPHWYWVAGLAAYGVSAMSVAGMLLVSVSFVLLALALGHTLGWVRGRPRALVAILLGLAAWGVVASSVDDYWVFWPIGALIPDA